MTDTKERMVAWVTGSARGIGRAIAQRLAEDGFNVVLHGRTPYNLQSSGEGNDLNEVAAAMAEATGREVMVVCGELTDEAVVKKCMEEIVRRFGRLDALVCNAGGSNLTGAVSTESCMDSACNFQLERLQQVMAHNILPTVLCVREAMPYLRKSPQPRIVTVGSIAACGGNKTMGRAFVPYSMAKAAIHQYTRCLGGELRSEGIPANCIIPGNINTPSTRIKFGGDRENPTPGLSRLEHVGLPEDIAGMASFLCSKDGAYVTGQCLRVDGGEQLFEA